LKPDVSTVEICITTIGTNCLNRSVSTPSPDTREGIFSNSFHPRKREQKANQTGSGLYHSIVKELVLPGRQEELRTNPNLTDAVAQSQAVLSKKEIPKRSPRRRAGPFSEYAKAAARLGISLLLRRHGSQMRHRAGPTGLSRRRSRTSLEFQPPAVRRE